MRRNADNKRIKVNKKAFTLLELILVASIITVVCGATAVTISVFISNKNVMESRVEARQSQLDELMDSSVSVNIEAQYDTEDGR